MAVLNTASEFQFYATAADYPRRIVFSMDIRDRGLNMRTCVAFSKAKTVDPGPKQREANQRSHHQAMKLADEAHRVSKHLERTQRRIERLIEKLEQNPKKKPDAPKFAEKLKNLGLMKLFVRVHHGIPAVLGPREFARVIGRLKVGDCKDVELVDFNGEPLDCHQLMNDAAALENAVRDKVGKDNIRLEPLPLYGRKPKKEKDDQDDHDVPDYAARRVPPDR